MRRAAGDAFLIEVDGGVGPDNAAALVAAGADVLVAGNAVFKAADPRQAIAALVAAMDAGRQAIFPVGREASEIKRSVTAKCCDI